MGRITKIDGTSLNPIWPRLAQVKGTNVNITGGTIKGNVYGGGEFGTVYSNTYVTIGGSRSSYGAAAQASGTPTIYRDVFGGGYGSADYTDTYRTMLQTAGATYVYTPTMFAGLVGGDTYVDICGGWVKKNVYGGGEMASVGIINYECDPTTLEYKYIHKHTDVDNTFALSWPYEYEYLPIPGGTTHVTVTGGRVGITGKDFMGPFNANGDPLDSDGITVLSEDENNTVDAINKWCKDNTDGMIPKIFEYGDLNYDTIMVLLNALSFDAEWASQYPDYRCVEMTFRGETHDATVKMMFSSEGNYISGEHETGFVKYYKGNSYAFAAILPEEGISMEEYLACLDGEKLCKLLDFGIKEVNAGLPEFTFDWSGSLKKALKEMGIEQAFDRTADFSYLGAMEDGTNLLINNVCQKTHIEVDQSGTRAAAVTEVEVVPEEEPDEIYEVILDRPFVYAIIDMQSRLPVFIGCLTDIG